MAFIAALFHPPKDPVPQLQADIRPLIDQEKKQSAEGYAAGTADVASARNSLAKISEYWGKIQNGPPDELLKMFDASGVTKQADENEQNLGEMGVRGGARAATLGSAAFTRDAELNRVVQQLRAAAPSQLAQIAQTLGNLGLGEESAAGGAGAQASQNIFGVANVGLQQQSNYYQLVSSVITAGAHAAGMAAGGA